MALVNEFGPVGVECVHFILGEIDLNGGTA